MEPNSNNPLPPQPGEPSSPQPLSNNAATPQPAQSAVPHWPEAQQQPSLSTSGPVGIPVTGAGPVSEPAAAQPTPVAATPPVSFQPPEPGAGPVVGGGFEPEKPAGRRKFSLSVPKRMLVPIVAAVVVLSGTAAAYFGYVAPNKPENMWHSALVNSGKGYDKLTDYATTNKHAKGWSETGSFKFKGVVMADGAISGKSDGATGNFSGTLSATGLKLGMDVRSFKSTGDTPDIYFKVSGLQDLGSLIGGFGADPSIATALNGLNNQWYVVDHTLFDQYAQGANTSMHVTSADVSSILDAVGKASKQYVFTADDKNAVVTVKQNVGKEKLGDRSVYHYKVAVNKQKLKLYLKELCTDLKASKLSKVVPSENTLNCTDMQKSADQVKDGDTADAWVDTHTKLIRNIRFHDSVHKNDYFDIGQDYQGGTVFPFLLAAHSKEGSTTSDFALKLTLDTKTNVIKLNGQMKSSGEGAENGTVELSVVPNNDPVTVDKPANPKTIIQLMNDLGLGGLLGAPGALSSAGSSSGTGTVQSKARDSKRQSDIQSLQAQLEAYNAQHNGHYPSLTDMNSAAWRKANMSSLDESALQDPQGSGKTLAAAPRAKAYAYKVGTAGGASCESNDKTCVTYTLTATLEAGGVYSKSNLF